MWHGHHVGIENVQGSCHTAPMDLQRTPTAPTKVQLTPTDIQLLKGIEPQIGVLTEACSLCVQEWVAYYVQDTEESTARAATVWQ
mmetsp:Transcript_106288/g.183259  ORF Transcript_106288/g.183259 Transcript_106288/m.183259 type:complete len:85 (+) Transcript_106288:664-918(+)